MSQTLLLLVLIVPMVLALGFGVWAGLGYPGLYGKYEKTGRAPRRTPFDAIVDWVMRKLGG